MTVRILYMTEHLKKNRHDFNVQRKAVQLIQARKRLLKYLKRVSLERYFDMVSKLDLKNNELVQ
jgi:small subunit ribosomal protein S15